MKTWNIIGLAQCAVLLLFSSPAFSQKEISQDREVPQQNVALLSDTTLRNEGQTGPVFSQAELDQMLAPIALYPDSLLSQILMASTYPLEVIEAARWSKTHTALQGEDAVQAVADYPWDPSVKSLVAFPQVLATMDEQLNWMERLGDAVLSQQQQVMESIQNLRQKASAAGNLDSSDQMQVEHQNDSIVLEPTNPHVVYVPYYDPALVYGAWWWPAYPPVFWAPWPSYFVTPVSRFGVGFYWSFGVPVGPRCWFGAFNWPSRYVTYSPGLVWVHSPIHRHAVPYRNYAVPHRLSRMNPLPVTPRQFRGGLRAPSVGQRTPGQLSGPRWSFGNRQVIPRTPNRSNSSLGTGPRLQPRIPAMGNMRSHSPQPHFRSPGRPSFRGSAPRSYGGRSQGGHFSSHGGGGGRHR